MLKDKGVTRFKSKDFEIELMPTMPSLANVEPTNTDEDRDELLFYSAPERQFA